MSDPLSPDHPPRPTGRSQPKPVVGAAVPFFLALLVLVGLAYGGWKWWQVRQFELARGQAIPVSAIGEPITDFEMTERSGQLFRSADMKGKVWVATYFFTTCPGNCIRLNQNIQLLHNLPELEDVTWVSITCDPDTDNVKALNDYADRWQADPKRWLFVRAPLEYTQRVAKGMNLALFRKGHQDYAIVFDKAGKVRGMFDAASRSQCERMHTMLEELQKEKAPETMAASSTDEQRSS
jgi:cytochrome oxidase Cu insertion factor (SCO1/SenC/PrrC family)